jgi:hypothetical protein
MATRHLYVVGHGAADPFGGLSAWPSLAGSCSACWDPNGAGRPLSGRT